LCYFYMITSDTHPIVVLHCHMLVL
jgi:hypothetical protein